MSIVCVVCVAEITAFGVDAAADLQTATRTQSGRANTWSARSSTGLTVFGTWTAAVDPKTGSVAGTWTLINEQGKTIMAGGWSATKSPNGWAGAWRAVVTGRKDEYSGEWTADIDLKANGTFADLFARAVKTVVSGSWRTGRQSGAWSIRVFE